MLEPDFLTVAELADRWKQTERQIIGHAEALRLPLYFAFDGLAFDINDRWHRTNGDWEVRLQYEGLSRAISGNESNLQRHFQGLTGEYDGLTPDDIIALRARVGVDKLKCDALGDLLQQRDRERLRFEFRGYMRAAPKTVWDIAATGTAIGVELAYHPAHPIKLALVEGKQVADGRLMALEPLVPGHGWRGVLTTADMLIAMAHIKAIEHPKPAAPAPDGDTKKPCTPENHEQELASMFDPVHYEALEKMLPSGRENGWRSFTEKAANNGLIAAREGRAMFNPMLAALWWLDKQHPPGWDLAKVNRVLAKNLPLRSRGNEHLFTGEYD